MIERLLQAERTLAIGRLDDAERIYWQVLENDAHNAIATVGLARVALERGEDRTAYAFACKALELDPDNFTAVRLEQRLAEVMTTRGETVVRPPHALEAAARSEAGSRARLAASERGASLTLPPAAPPSAAADTGPPAAAGPSAAADAGPAAAPGDAPADASADAPMRRPGLVRRLLGR